MLQSFSSRLRRLAGSVAFVCLLGCGSGWAQPVAPADFTVSLYAEETLLSNPVAITFDRQGRLYVSEARRKETGVWGVTFSRWWSMEDYQGSTLDDRLAMYERWAHVVPDVQLRSKSDLVRVVSDRDGDGIADHSAIFADGFNEPLDGNAAGVLAVDGSVYLTCIPHLWKLEDADGDLQAEIRESLHTGFGVRVGVHGHDLHGLIQGPDGKLYFSVGDRGYDVRSHEGEHFHESHRGAVFRCNLDGSGLEVFHRGLRNPQELAFNDRGDLFTVDNNMSGGDECRILHLLEGADSGWDAAFQLSGHFREETNRPDHPKPTWFTERLWAPPAKDAPLWHNAAVANLSRGPSGLVHYPGTGLPQRFSDSFFLADFVGSAAGSRILSFQLSPVGAGYELKKQETIVSNVLVTDLEFADDGSLYVADWINGWTGTGTGRVWRLTAPGEQENFETTRAALKEDERQLPNTLLVQSLGHPDRRVRLRAQFELVRRGELTELASAAGGGQSIWARIHGLWGLGQLAEQGIHESHLVDAVEGCLDDPDAEVRAQAAKVARGLPVRSELTEQLLGLLADPDNRVAYHALLSLRHHEAAGGVERVLERLAADAGEDRSLRHAVVSFLVEQLSEEQLVGLSRRKNEAVRVAALLALRRTRSESLVVFLNDFSERIRWEAARTIYDVPLDGLLANLAALATTSQWIDEAVPFPIGQRLIDANYRLGGSINAHRLATLASNSEVSFPLRLEAIRALRDWENPSVFDRVTWRLWPVLGGRDDLDKSMLREEMLPLYHALTRAAQTGDGSLQQQALLAVCQILIKHDLLDPVTTTDGVTRADLPLAVRRTFLDHLIKHGDLTKTLATKLVATDESELTSRVVAWLLQRGDPTGKELALAGLKNGDVPFLQALLDALGEKGSDLGRNVIESVREQLRLGRLPREVWLNLAEVMPDGSARQQPFESLLPDLDEGELALTKILTAEGGDVTEGERVFEQHAAQCQRCHRIAGNGGLAGPDLSRIGATLTREQLVEALLEPSKRLSPGYGSLTLDLTDGDVLSGVLRAEKQDSLTLVLGDFTERKVLKRDISSRTDVQSSMPPMGEVLTRREIRDLVAFLASLQ